MNGSNGMGPRCGAARRRACSTGSGTSVPWSGPPRSGAVYSRAIHVLGGHPDHLMIFGGETFDDMGLGLLTPFSATVINVERLLRDEYHL